MNKKYHIITYGCQMNENDSERLAYMLSEMDYEYTEDLLETNILIMNTCSIRENADDRFFGNLGRMKNIKKQNGMTIAVCGCMMQQNHVVDEIKKTYPFVDIIFGTHNIEQFPQLLMEHERNQLPVIKLLQDHQTPIKKIHAKRKYPFKAFVPIMSGCNNFCTYCVVPYTRGREKSRAIQDIIDEVTTLAQSGVKEIMLLGQNVNSYGLTNPGETTFAQLLQRIDEIDGIKRIRFMTSHPKDLSDELIETMQQGAHISKHIHLPLQSGSSRVLKRMNRYYDKESYLALTRRIKRAMPDIGLSTDIIVGFPGESEEDFKQTLDVINQVRYDSAFTFIYSPRKGTKAYEWPIGIEEDEIKRRFNQLLETQQRISAENNARFTAQTLEVLTEGKSKTNKDMLTGRTDDNRLVNFFGNATAGEVVDVFIDEAKTFYLKGRQL